MSPVWLRSVAVYGPGLDGWGRTRSVLRRQEAYVSTPLTPPSPTLLPPRDRRRCSDAVSLALYVAQQTVVAAGLDAATTSSVFANSAGDGPVIHRLLSSLAKPGRPISPTDFHNSVHNASAFYWSLGTGCHQASTSISGARFSFAAALLRAAVQCLTDDTPIFLVCFDSPLPRPLDDTYPITGSLGVGLALLPRQDSGTLAQFELSWILRRDSQTSSSQPKIPGLCELWSGNPAGQALPLLEAVANEGDSSILISGMPDAFLQVQVKCR